MSESPRSIVIPAASRESATGCSDEAQRAEQQSALVVTIHRFQPAPADVACFTRELTDHVRNVALPGLIRARVVRQYGSSRVAVVAEWDQLSTEVVASAALHRDARLAEILRRSREADFDAYVTTDAEGARWRAAAND